MKFKVVGWVIVILSIGMPALALPIDLETVIIDISEINILCSALFVILLGIFVYRKLVKSANRS